jgi:hypothetical protein
MVVAAVALADNNNTAVVDMDSNNRAVAVVVDNKFVTGLAVAVLVADNSSNIEPLCRE